MKKTTIMVATCFLAFIGSAQNQEIQSQQFTEESSQEVKFELVEAVEGIEVFYARSKSGSNTMLDIQFKNTTNEPVSFYWTIARDNGLTYKGSKLITIKPEKLFTEKYALELKGSNDFTSYPINITIK